MGLFIVGGRLGWWAPHTLVAPWRPRVWMGTDEWHNPSVSVTVPFLGAFHWWFTDWRDDTDGHYTPAAAPDCRTCQNLFADPPANISWREWLRPAR